MADLDSLVATAQEKISGLIQRPKMTDKLLSKPPFRFLHDTISAVISTTGFGDGLYNDQEKDSATIAEKQQKLDYLDKIFRFVGICQGQALDVKSAKVVAGLEPEFTNMFLIALAQCATNDSIDNEQAVKRCLNGEEPGQGRPPLRNSKASVAESKGDDSTPSKPSRKPGRDDDNDDKPSRDNSRQRTPQEESKPSRSRDNSTAAAMENLANNIPSGNAERGVSRGGSRGGKPNVATPDIALGGISSTVRPSNMDSMIEKCDGSEELTQSMLGELIQKPKLTSKLLSKPPFRFLFDIVIEVISQTGFAAGLYNDSEIDSSNITEKQQKIDFLEKIIKVVGIQLNTLVEARPAKIVAGLDPNITNNFLQLLALSAKHMPQSSNAVGMALAQLGGGDANNGQTALAQQNESKNDSREKERSIPEDKNISSPPRNKGNAASDDSARQKSPAAPEIIPYMEPKKESMLEKMNRAVTSESKGGEDVDSGAEVKRSARPSTAGRRPPKVKDNVSTAPEVAPAIVTTEAKAAGILIEGQDDDDIPDESNIRLADDFNRADSKDIPSGNPADAGQSKLVKDILSRQVEQSAQSDSKGGDNKDTQAVPNSGGIRLMRNKQLGGKGGEARPNNLNNSNHSQTTGAAGTNTTNEADMERLRSSIQSLVQQTGPLGTCMDFIQEDLDTMTSELRKWEDEGKKYEFVHADECKKSREILRPMELELTDLKDQINEKVLRIASLKGVILRNEERLYEVYKTSAIL